MPRRRRSSSRPLEHLGKAADVHARIGRGETHYSELDGETDTAGETDQPTQPAKPRRRDSEGRFA